MGTSRDEPLQTDQLVPLCSLEDRTRRRLYEYVAATGRPVSRDEASRAVVVDRSLAAYHLDKLVDEGLLVASYARPPGRGGPGAGRPSKHYERAPREFSITIPPRDYELAGEIFLRAVEEDESGEMGRALEAAAGDTGRDLAAEAGHRLALLDQLRSHGFEPYDDDGVVRLRNCPFHHLAQRHTNLVCGMNLRMLAELIAARGDDFHVRLDPAPGRCCVALEPA